MCVPTTFSCGLQHMCAYTQCMLWGFMGGVLSFDQSLLKRQLFFQLVSWLGFAHHWGQLGLQTVLGAHLLQHEDLNRIHPGEMWSSPEQLSTSLIWRLQPQSEKGPKDNKKPAASSQSWVSPWGTCLWEHPHSPSYNTIPRNEEHCVCLVYGDRQNRPS